ncbi:SEC14-like protein 5 [Asterias amurensis]|uniref:SEC14-like protein 5 n=1 Tax=Asterias amurensis TaxID=7602 RepID=UPI003AB34A1E
MVQNYKSPVRVYKHSFELVMAAYQKRFPTCKMIPIFLGSEILSEYKSEDGAIHIVERRCKLNMDAPYLLKKIVGVDYIYFIQKNSLNWRERTLKIEAYNESFSSRIIVIEGCTYFIHPENPDWTCFEQTASLEVKSFFSFENTVEKFAVKQYAASLKKGKEILLYYINELIEEGFEPGPTWAEVHKDDPIQPASDHSDSEPSSQSEDETEEESKKRLTLEVPQAISANGKHSDGHHHRNHHHHNYGSNERANETPSTSGLRGGETSTKVHMRRRRLASSAMEKGAVGGMGSEEEVSKVDEDYIEQYLGPLTLLQESRLIQLREWLSETHKGKMPKDMHLLRFLRARDFNTEKAHEMITASLAWRKQHQVDKILSTWVPPEILLVSFAGGWHYHDSDGRPLYIVRLGQMDVKGLIKAAGEEAILRHVLSINEEGMRRTEEATKKAGRPISSWTCLVDCEGLSMRHLWRPGVKALLRMIEVVEANYPETMGKLLIVRAPRVFPVIWTLVSPFIDENTRQKFLIYGGKNYMEHVGGLPDHIEQQYIPDFLGGDCFCDIPEGGLIPKTCYRSMEDLQNPDELPLCSETIYKSATLQKGLPQEVVVHITDMHQVLTWDFDILRGDVVFSVLMSRHPLTVHKEPMGPMGLTNTVVIDKSMVCGVDFRQVELPLVCRAGASIQGTHVCQATGWYILQWKFYSNANQTKADQAKAHQQGKGHHHHHKSKVMYYYEVLSHEDFRGSMSSLKSGHSGFSALSISSTGSSKASASSSQVSR